MTLVIDVRRVGDTGHQYANQVIVTANTGLDGILPILPYVLKDVSRITRGESFGENPESCLPKPFSLKICCATALNC